MVVVPHLVQNRADVELSVPSVGPGAANKDTGDYMKHHNVRAVNSMQWNVKKLATFFCVLLGPLSVSPSHARTYEINNEDKMTGDRTAGIVIESEDGQALIGFMCDYLTMFTEGNRYIPRITFSHKNFLTSSGNSFTLAYKIDEHKVQYNTFRAGSDHMAGNFIVWGIRGDPPFFNNIKNTEAAFFEFARGFKAIVRVTDYIGKQYTYDFDLSGILARLPLVRRCYSN